MSAQASVFRHRLPNTRIEVKSISASFQYSNNAEQADFAVPYEILAAPKAIQEMMELIREDKANCVIVTDG